MSEETWINNAGSAAQLRELWLNNAGVASQVQEIWVNDNGVARCIFRNSIVSLGDAFVLGEYEFGAAYVDYSLLSNGNIGWTGTEALGVDDPWIAPQSGMSNYECRATHTGGDAPSGTFGAWQSLSTTRTWSFSRSASASASGSFLLEIRRSSNAVVVASATITMGISRI